MYVVKRQLTFAIDLATGRQIWRSRCNTSAGALRVATSAR